MMKPKFPLPKPQGEPSTRITMVSLPTMTHHPVTIEEIFLSTRNSSTTKDSVIIGNSYEECFPTRGRK